MGRRGGHAWATPLWRKAPVTLLWHRTALAAVTVAGLLVALAASSAPFVTTASASSALKSNLEGLAPLATGLQVHWHGEVTGSQPAIARVAAARAAAFRALSARLGLEQPVLTLQSAEFQVTSGSGDRIVLMARSGVLSHVQVLRKVPGPGVWISDHTARDVAVKVGGTLRFEAENTAQGSLREVPLRVKGIYRALDSSAPGPYWANFIAQILPPGVDPPPPARFVFMSEADLLRIAGKLQSTAVQRFNGRVFRRRAGIGLFGTAELAVDPAGLTLARARDLSGSFNAFRHGLARSSLGGELHCGAGGSRAAPPGFLGIGQFSGPRCAASSSLSSAVALADRSASEISPGVSLLAGAGTAIALAVAGAAGVFLVRRRAAETALLFARGEHPAAYVSRTVLELLLPTVLGAAAGFGIAAGLTGVFAPSGSVDGDTVSTALARAGLGAAAALALAAGAAGVLFHRQFDTTRRRAWLRWLPWELPLLGVALWLLVDVLTGGGLARGSAGAAGHPTLAVFAYPLLLVAAAAGIVMRVLRPALRRQRAREAGLPTAVFLALRRLTAARGVLTALVVVAAVAFGAYFYAQALAGSLSHNVAEKAYVAYGGDVQAISSETDPLPRNFPYPITRVTYGNQSAVVGSADGTPADVLTVDPETLPHVLRWYSDWGRDPRTEIAALGSGAPLRAIATRGVPTGTRAIWLEGTRVPIEVVARVRSFPGMTPDVPLVVLSAPALDHLSRKLHLYEPLGTPQSYLWAKGPPGPVARALAKPDTGAYYVTTVDAFRQNPDVLLAKRTFSYMRMIAAAAGILVALGLLLYLQARQRAQAVGSALAGRMGLRRRTEVVSLTLELLAITLLAAVVGGAVALAAASPIVPHLDPLPDSPPPPVLVVPWLAVGLAVLALAVLVPAFGALTTRAARRTDMSEALRVA